MVLHFCQTFYKHHSTAYIILLLFFHFASVFLKNSDEFFSFMLTPAQYIAILRILKQIFPKLIYICGANYIFLLFAIASRRMRLRENHLITAPSFALSASRIPFTVSSAWSSVSVPSSERSVSDHAVLRFPSGTPVPV